MKVIALLSFLLFGFVGQAQAADIMKEKNWSCAVEAVDVGETTQLRWIADQEKDFVSTYEATLNSVGVKVEVLAVNAKGAEPGVHITLTDVATGVSAYSHYVPALPSAAKPAPSVRIFPHGNQAPFAQVYCFKNKN